MTHAEAKAMLLQDEETRLEYEKLESRYAVIRQMIELRKEAGLTQEELAKRCGMQKSNISRLESGNYNPSLDLLVKIANGLGKKININIL